VAVAAVAAVAGRVRLTPSHTGSILPAMRRCPHTRWSVAVAAVLAAYTGVPVLGAMHALTERHSVCVEHGALVHLPHGADAITPGPALPGFGKASAPAATRPHDHCALSPHDSRVPAFVEDRGPTQRDAVACLVTEPAPSPPVLPDPLGRAPKQSPPAG